jgi:hypothetical protein
MSSKLFRSLDDYVHHTRTLIQKSGLEGEKWFIACFLNGIPNSDYHWVVHDKDPATYEVAVDIVLRYMRTSQKDHNKPEPLGQNPRSFSGKHKTPNDDTGRNTKRILLSCAYCKKKGNTKDNC